MPILPNIQAKPGIDRGPINTTTPSRNCRSCLADLHAIVFFSVGQPPDGSDHNSHKVAKTHIGNVLIKAVYLAIGITMEGVKEVLGMWIAAAEGAAFWLQIVTELRNRGVQDILIACVDAPRGFSEAIVMVFPMYRVGSVSSIWCAIL